MVDVSIQSGQSMTALDKCVLNYTLQIFSIKNIRSYALLLFQCTHFHTHSHYHLFKTCTREVQHSFLSIHMCTRFVKSLIHGATVYTGSGTSKLSFVKQI